MWMHFFINEIDNTMFHRVVHTFQMTGHLLFCLQQSVNMEDELQVIKVMSLVIWNFV